ncbi:MAG: hypothetical protein LBD31_06385 [Treponema sp.]|jgi:hypothetical protein|nr:hypothetical protein [Treponema sp.]
MKAKKNVLGIGLFLVFGLAAYDNGTTPDNAMLTYLTTINTRSPSVSPLAVLPARAVLGMARSVESSESSIPSVSMEGAFGGSIAKVYRLNRSPDPSWLIEPYPIEITDIPTGARYVFFLQSEKEEGYDGQPADPGDNREAAYYDCYEWNSDDGYFRHKEGKDWYLLIYDQVEKTFYGSHRSLYVTPDLEGVKVIYND